MRCINKNDYEVVIIVIFLYVKVIIIFNKKRCCEIQSPLLLLCPMLIDWRYYLRRKKSQGEDIALGQHILTRKSGNSHVANTTYKLEERNVFQLCILLPDVSVQLKKRVSLKNVTKQYKKIQNDKIFTRYSCL